MFLAVGPVHLRIVVTINLGIGEQILSEVVDVLRTEADMR